MAAYLHRPTQPLYFSLPKACIYSEILTTLVWGGGGLNLFMNVKSPQSSGDQTTNIYRLVEKFVAAWGLKRRGSEETPSTNEDHKMWLKAL